MTTRAIIILSMINLVFAADAGAQQFEWPEEPENIQVLPESAKGEMLRRIMRGFVGALDVRCDHCHVGEGGDLTTYDFASDEKVSKQRARIMIEMVMAMNTDYLSRLPNDEISKNVGLEVSCMTCHRGNVRPLMLRDVLRDKLASDGLDAAEATYRELRERHFGGFTYDFSPDRMSRFGDSLANSGDIDAALRFIAIEQEFNGESWSNLFSLGNTLALAGDAEGARAAFIKGIEMAPEHWKPAFEQRLSGLAENE